MSICDFCDYFAWDDEGESRICEVNLDEDEMARFLSGRVDGCPYYRSTDEYDVVRRQN